MNSKKIKDVTKPVPDSTKYATNATAFFFGPLTYPKQLKTLI